MESTLFALIACVMVSAAYGLSIEMPQGCEGKRYCDKKPDNFPQKFFDDHIQEYNLFVRNNRYKDEPREVIHNTDPYNCHTKVTIIQPYVVKSNTTNKLVVQSSFFQQWVRQTECLTNGARCFESVMKPSLTSACTPVDGTIKLYLYDPLLDRFEHEPVTFPICCACKVNSRI